MANQTIKWSQILNGWGKQTVAPKKFQCPYCSQKFRELKGVQGHRAAIHKKHGKEKPTFGESMQSKLKRSVGKDRRTDQLKKAREKAKLVSERKHRSKEECEELIKNYETGLLEMTAEEYKLKTGISKQKIHRIRMKLKKMRKE